MSFFEITVLVLLTLILLIVAAVFAKVCLPSDLEVADLRFELELEKDLERDKASRNIDEGIANIMSYSVNGKTGFEQDEF